MGGTEVRKKDDLFFLDGARIWSQPQNGNACMVPVNDEHTVDGSKQLVHISS